MVEEKRKAASQKPAKQEPPKPHPEAQKQQQKLKSSKEVPKPKQDSSKQEAVKQAPVKQEVPKQEAAKQEPAKQEAAKPEPTKAEVAKQESKQEEVAKPQDPNAFSVSITVEPAICDINQQVTVTWEVTSGKSTPSDWIGMYVSNPAVVNKKYITCYYRGENEKKGVVTFYATIYGKYEFRYLRSYTHFGKTQTVEVGPQFEIAAKLVEADVEKKTSSKIVGEYKQKSGNEYKSAWVGLYLKGSTSYVTYENVKTSSGQVSFNIPAKKGEYELRFFSQKYDCVATSNLVAV